MRSAKKLFGPRNELRGASEGRSHDKETRMKDSSEAVEFYAAFARSPHPAALFADTEGYVRFWNVGAERLFGHMASEAVGPRVDLIVPISLREAHWTGFNRALASSNWRGSQDWGSVPALHRNGEQITLEVFLFQIQKANGSIGGVLALFRAPRHSELNETDA